MITDRILAVLVVLIIGSGCQSDQTTNIPDGLVGIWETSAKKYQDRFMEFNKDAVIFGTGDGNQSVQPIRKVKTVRENNKDLYTITYLDEDDAEYSFSFYYDPVGGVIMLKNQEEIEWKKSPSTTD
ncbi:MAG TPA: hypothetical protein VFH55_04085 [Nitrospiria bacterium]|nr:hypothetical protein [Nitrospiria bacterium]